MKLTALPLLEEGSAPLEIDDMTPRKCCDLLDAHKAFVLKNVDNPLDVEGFGELLVSLDLTYYPYIGGAAPRTVIPVKASDKPIVFTANESPPEQPIPFHHEIAQVANPPEYVFFYCDTPPSTGGQTPLIDSTKVYRFVKDNHPVFLEKVVTHGVRYIRTLPPKDDPTSPLGRSYQNSWNVSTPAELEAKLEEVAPGCEYTWHENGDVTIISESIPAIRLVSDHAQNAVQQWTFCNSLVAAFLGWQDSRNDRKKALLFGNMEAMDLDVLQSVAEFMVEHRVLYSWQHGDVLAINNRLVMHSREPFTGPRRVLASIWGPPQESVQMEQPPNNLAIGLRPKSYYQTLHPKDPLVFGFWKVGKDVCEEVAYQAICNGYRRLDCACDYGNEEQVGQGIARALKDGLVQRDELYITSKLWNTYHKPEHVPLGLQKSLDDLGLAYLDEYLIHFPISMEYVPIDKKYPPEWTNMEDKMMLVQNDMCATWAAMESLVDRKLVHRIGVCNFTAQLLRQILSTCRIRPTTLQVELHPHNSQSHLIRFARDAGMHVTAFSVFGAASYLELDMATKDDVLFTNSVVTEIAQRHNKTPAQILLRWALQRNTFPLSKTLQPNRMVENRNVFDFYLPGLDMTALNGLNQNRRYNDPGAFCEPGMGTFCPIYE
mmetsp:Transcript_5489/g.9054  ORF Transcript_5489/g.9054 Transcript_5489/m.9054 type:complete len:657 (+) Transcript_5489:103-2073(+)|eukprot:CAMPEP_0119008612 /NCGR_PEP_ID=MMETSP1176-20130426/3820_1 /TAXON_ID=265551 /ORGANISM="Synedropsis recta cf, Strain CCMP1620" /LENGTH=656 /DNA_ID=CAMNT_0006960975 /DNA_START=52 /DNA_END=2022 /DNA_ORIENTATION=+